MRIILTRPVAAVLAADHVKLVRLWSTYATETFRDTVHAVHQQITLRIMLNGYQNPPEESDEEDLLMGHSTRRHIEDDEVVADSVRYLRLVFYASLLGSVDDRAALADVKGRERDAEKQFADFCELQRLQVDEMLEDPQVRFEFEVLLRSSCTLQRYSIVHAFSFSCTSR